MSKLRDLTLENPFGRLTAIEIVGRRSRKILWRCRCECGTESIVQTGDLVNARAVSCGCHRIEVSTAKCTTHGRSGSPTHNSSRAMRSRCTDQSSVGYKNYGGRGVQVCGRWADSFENFIADM